MGKAVKRIWFLHMVIYTTVFCLTLTSCNDNDNSEPNDPNNEYATSSILIGKWAIVTPDPPMGTGYAAWIQFISDGSYVSIESMPSNSSIIYETRGTWSLKDNRLKLVGELYEQGHYLRPYNNTFDNVLDNSQRLTLKQKTSGIRTMGVATGVYSKYTE